MAGVEETRMKFRAVCLVFLLTTALLVFPCLAWAVTQYQLRPLGDFAPSCINIGGQIAGCRTDAQGKCHAYLWDNGVTRDLGTLGGTMSLAFDLNNAGQVIGYSEMPDVTYHAFIWADGSMRDLGPRLNGGCSYGFGINNHGQAAGWVTDNLGESPFVYDNDAMTAPDSPQPYLSYACDINDLGQVVGGVGPDAFMWDHGATRNLGNLGGGTEAHCINNLGQVVGQGTNTQGYARAFLWDNGMMRELGTLGGNTSGLVRGGMTINDLGQIVGGADDANCQQRAFLWQSGQMWDINNLLDQSGVGWSLTYASGVNNLGQIVGYGINPSGEAEAFLLTPVPEPSPIIALLSGIIIAAGSKLTRKR